eukprot:gene15153-20413_t
MDVWYKVSEAGSIAEGGRIHVRVEGRFVTLFRNRGILSAIDSICHHAGGPLTLGPLQDIEELGLTVVLCPWHKFMVSIDGGLKAYKAVDVSSGKPVVVGWKVGKVVQRPHRVLDHPSGIYISLQITEEECTSDRDANSELCAQDYPISIDTVSPVDITELLQENSGK